MDLLDAGDPDSHAAKSGILSASDGIQLRQPVRDCLRLPCCLWRMCPLVVPHVSLEYSMEGIQLPPCIAGKASSLQSDNHLELTPLEILRNYNAPLCLTLF